MTRQSTNSVLQGAKCVELTEGILRVFYAVYNELGFGFLESVYQEAMRVALIQAGLQVRTQMPIEATFRGQVIGLFKADLVVDDVVLLELKTASMLTKEHHSQTLNYLRATALGGSLVVELRAWSRSQEDCPR